MPLNKFIPVKCGLSDKNCYVPISVNNDSSSICFDKKIAGKTYSTNIETETIKITTIDGFAAEKNIPRVDFIKADIEGAERDMLKGAANVLREFAPKLAICTYHLPDDPDVLENLILEANPKYKVVHLGGKLFAAVV
ncbi:MAG: hypothetical protein Ta2B_25150 [Termitinemataceae bacterium]|nr:MAG: hypothetical protein Ta2B_25150 [Termitinemataceae bacterium]